MGLAKRLDHTSAWDQRISGIVRVVRFNHFLNS